MKLRLAYLLLIAVLTSPASGTASPKREQPFNQQRSGYLRIRGTLYVPGLRRSKPHSSGFRVYVHDYSEQGIMGRDPAPAATTDQDSQFTIAVPRSNFKGKEISIFFIVYGPPPSKTHWFAEKEGQTQVFHADEDATEIDVGEINWKWKPALSTFIESRDEEWINKALSDGDDINEGGEWDCPISVAAKSKRWDIVRRLAQLGADVNRMPHPVSTVLILAAKANELDLVKLLVEKGADVNESPGLDGPPITHAVHNSNVNMVRFLATRGADLNTGDDRRTNKPLSEAAKKGDATMARLLLELGANVNAEDPPEAPNPGYTPLHYAVLGRQPEVVRFLISKGADLNGERNRSDAEYTPLLLAAEMGDSRMVEVLLELGAKVDQTAKRDRYGTALRLAVGWERVDTVIVLLAQKANANFGVDRRRNVANDSLLHIAARKGNLQIVKLLVANGADVSVRRISDGATALDLAEKDGKAEVAAFLRSLR